MVATNDSTTGVFVYFISAGANPIKIGISADPFSRLADLQTAHYKKLHLLFTIECLNRAAALELESAFHRWYEDRHIRLEWYDVTPDKIAADIRLLHGLSRAISDVCQHTPVDKLEQLIERANGYGQGYTRTTDAQARAIEWFDEHKDEANTLTVRQLAELSGIGKTSIADALKVWKQQQPGALVQSTNGNGHGEVQS